MAVLNLKIFQPGTQKKLRKFEDRQHFWKNFQDHNRPLTMRIKHQGNMTMRIEHLDVARKNATFSDLPKKHEWVRAQEKLLEQKFYSDFLDLAAFGCIWLHLVRFGTYARMYILIAKIPKT